LNGKIIAEQIGAQIFIDGWAMVAPGNPELAADLSKRAGFCACKNNHHLVRVCQEDLTVLPFDPCPYAGKFSSTLADRIDHPSSILIERDADPIANSGNIAFHIPLFQPAPQPADELTCFGFHGQKPSLSTDYKSFQGMAQSLSISRFFCCTIPTIWRFSGRGRRGCHHIRIRFPG